MNQAASRMLVAMHHSMKLSNLLCGLLAVLGGCDDTATARQGQDALVLPGDAFHPEGLAVDSDANLYIGSVGTGEILRVAPGDTAPTPFIAAGTGGLTSAVGLAVDEDAGKLWVCSADATFTRPNALVSFELATGRPVDSFPLPGGVGICNDLVRDPRGNLYVTDSIVGRILRLPVGGSALEVWSADPALAPRTMGEFTVNGADHDAATDSLFVVKSSTGELFRIPIAAAGEAGAPIPIALDRALHADGLKALDSRTLFAVEDGGVTRVTLAGDQGTTARIADGLEQPSGIVLEGDSAWVAEGQIGRLVGFDPTPKVLPFALQRVAIR
jgi:sugar lactone lactonase YvrE